MVCRNKVEGEKIFAPRLRWDALQRRSGIAMLRFSLGNTMRSTTITERVEAAQTAQRAYISTMTFPAFLVVRVSAGLVRPHR